ncbi:MAG TPA: DUF3857 domain-containing protein [Holophaga sp.]|nr:DUF3857 domain-containing protein [Holophaga sp.]
MPRAKALVMLLLAGAGALLAGGPWDGAPLAADPRAVMEAAKAHPPREGKPVLILFESRTWVLDAQGRRRRHVHTVYRIDGAAALKEWSEVGAGWGPWYQSRPVVRARVITPEGQVHAMDPATLGEYSTGQGGEGLFESRKTLNGPLPHTSVGAIVEEEIQADDTEPFFDTGSMARVPLAHNVPVVEARFTLDVPEGQAIHWRLLNMPGVKPAVASGGGRTRITVQAGPLDSPKEWEPLEDPAKEPIAAFCYSTLPSWSHVARAYAPLVKLAPLPPDMDALALEIKASGLPREQAAARLLAAVQKRVRYTGVEFGEAAVVPREPRETLQRGFGDCKDKATLLVALLERAGHPARVALLKTGPGLDVEPDMPGMGLFDHAIVVMPGPDPLWIDPTVELAPAGLIPWQDQGRLALIVDPGTRELARTPRPGMEANRVVERRALFLSEWGPARVEETTEYAGLDALSIRAGLSGLEPKALRENMERYIKEAYGAKALGRMEVPDLKDVSVPVTFFLEGKEVPRAMTWWRDAKAELHVWPMLSDLIKALEGEDASKHLPARTKDLLWRVPYVKEWIYEVHPSPGYVLRQLPQGDVIQLGPAAFRRSYQIEKDGTVIARHRLETGPERWTAEQVEAARKAIKAFGETSRVDLVFDQEGEALLKAGKTREGLAALRRLAEARPGSAIVLAHQAQALLAVGLGEAARAKAKQAANLDPNLWIAQETLGWVLQFDLVGRRFKPGWDREGAIAAYERAWALDKAEWAWRGDYAYLLEHDADGGRYTPKSSLARAIEVYRFIRDEIKSDAKDEWLLGALGEAGRHKEALELARKLKASAFRNGWLAAALVHTQGVDKALAELPGFLGSQWTWQDAVAPAVLHLTNAGAYAQAAKLIQGAPQTAEGAEQRRVFAEALAKAVPVEQAAKDKADPKAALFRFAHALAVKQAGLDTLAPLMTPALKTYLAGAKRWPTFKGYVESLDLVFRDLGLKRAAAMDLTLCASQYAVDGDAARGYRIKATFPGVSGGAYHQEWYFSVVDGECRLSGTSNSNPSLGVEALRRADAGDLPGARLFLDWARDLVRRGGGDDPLDTAPFPCVWTRGQAGTADDVRWAAAALLAWNGEDARVEPLLTEALAKARDLNRRTYFRLALAFRHDLLDQYDRLETSLAPLRADYPDSVQAQLMALDVLAGREDWKGHLAQCDAFLAANPENPRLKAARETALRHLEPTEARIRRLQEAADKGEATASSLNTLAWLQVVLDRTDDKTLEIARRAVRMASGDDSAIQHTLATVLANLGSAGEALQSLQKSMVNRSENGPGPNEWYVVGRIAEALGEVGAARACYQRVDPPGKESREAPGETCHALAVRRLARLGK